MTQAEEIVKLLSSKGQKVTFAESCTGGMLCSSLVDVAGASWVLDESYVTYANSAKQKLLGVSAETLASCGAVSPECAYEMAQGAKKAACSDYAVAVTGIAGPDGGTAEKPVGLVYIGISDANGTTTYRNIFVGDRTQVRRATVQKALELLKEHIK